MKIEIVKTHKLLDEGRVLDIDHEYALHLINKGIAKKFGEVGKVDDKDEEKTEDEADNKPEVKTEKAKSK
jgi:hypothetical protein